MRRHAPRPRSFVAAVALVATAALSSSCGIAAPTVAATVDGDEISIDAVTRLAGSEYLAAQASQSFGQVSTPEGTEGSAVHRLALSILVQDRVYRAALREQKASPTADDRARADELLAEIEGQGGEFDPTARPVVVRLVLAQVTLARVVAGADTSDPVTAEKIEAFFEANRQQFGELTCLNGFQVLAEDAPAAQAAVDGGATVEDVVAMGSIQVQPLSTDGQEMCIDAAQVNEAIADLVGTTPVGEWASTTVEAQGGQSIALFLRPSSRGPAELDHPVVQQQIADQLSQEASVALQQALSDVGPAIEEVLDRLDVEIDPRYGRWDPTEPTLVVPPPVPRAANPAPGSPLTLTP